MIVVAASDEQWDELTGSKPGIDWLRVENTAAFNQYRDADAFFCFKQNDFPAEADSFIKPVIINSTVHTLAELNLPSNVYRINGWATFLNRSVWEIAGPADPEIETIFRSINTGLTMVKDEPGFISARVIAMIINEAYFALEQNVSSKDEIDTAMKLGTNYPFGPFEWALKIGKRNVLDLLQKLYLTDSRYKPSQLLIGETPEIN